MIEWPVPSDRQQRKSALVAAVRYKWKTPMRFAKLLLFAFAIGNAALAGKAGEQAWSVQAPDGQTRGRRDCAASAGKSIRINHKLPESGGFGMSAGDAGQRRRGALPRN